MADPYLRNLQARRLMMEMQARAAAQQQAQARFAEMQAAHQGQQQAQAQAQALQAQRLAQSGQLGAAGLMLREREFTHRQAADAERMRREAVAEKEAKLNRLRGTLRPGYRWSAQDPMQMELIPGGPEEQKMRGSHAEDLARAQAINNATQALVGRIGSILRPSAKGAFNSNFGGYNALVTQYLPGQTQDVRSEIEQLKSMLKTAGLSDIRGRSGQSIGAITEREWPVLAEQILRLNPLMSEPEAVKELGAARRQLLNMRNKELRQYQNEWEPTPFYQKNISTMPPIETQGRMKGIPKTFGHGEEVWNNLTPEEKELWVPGISQQN